MGILPCNSLLPNRTETLATQARNNVSAVTSKKLGVSLLFLSSLVRARNEKQSEKRTKKGKERETQLKERKPTENRSHENNSKRSTTTVFNQSKKLNRNNGNE